MNSYFYNIGIILMPNLFNEANADYLEAICETKLSWEGNTHNQIFNI